MDLGRLRSTEWILGSLGVALLGVMFLDWYEVGVTAADLEEVLPDDAFAPISGGVFGTSDGTLNAWEAFAVTDIVMAGAAILAVAVFIVTATQQTPAVPIALETLTGLLTLLASVFVFIRVLSVPGEGYVREVGPSLGLLLLIALTLAAWFGMRNERPGHGSYARAARERIAEIETIPAPER